MTLQDLPTAKVGVNFTKRQCWSWMKVNCLSEFWKPVKRFEIAPNTR